jgi:hypothetical protein
VVDRPALFAERIERAERRGVVDGEPHHLVPSRDRLGNVVPVEKEDDGREGENGHDARAALQPIGEHSHDDERVDGDERQRECDGVVRRSPRRCDGDRHEFSYRPSWLLPVHGDGAAKNPLSAKIARIGSCRSS